MGRRGTRSAGWIVPLSARRLPASIGGKAALLRRLADHGMVVPEAVVVTWEAAAAAAADREGARRRLADALAPWLQEERAYAVRSSADVEDGRAHSWAGQFTTVLDVRGLPAVLTAVERVWASAASPETVAYRKRLGVAAPRLGVLVQTMVPAQFSGVVFSKNPLTGLDEVIVEAVPGTGDRLVQAGATPERWVEKWGAWAARPGAPRLPEEVAAAVVAGCRQVERAEGRPVDLEWVYDGERLFWVQLRPITALRDLAIYSNRIAREVLPGQIKPLVWSVNVPLVNRAWIRLFSALVGPTGIDPAELSRAFYYRAYFNMALIGDILESLGFSRALLERLMGIDGEGKDRPSFRPSRRSWRHLPRLLRFLWASWRLPRMLPGQLDALRAAFEAVADADRRLHSEAELLETIAQLGARVEAAAYLNIVVPLQMQAWNRALARLRGPEEVDYDVQFEPSVATGLAALDPGRVLAELHDVYRLLPETVRERLANEGVAALERQPEAAPLRDGIASFTRRFGHLSESGNDFSAVPWRESPDLLLSMVVGWQAEARPASTSSKPGPGRNPRGRWPGLAVARRAGRFRLFREQISSLYTYGYGLHRDLYLALGDRLVERGLLRGRDDIFWLYADEVRQLALNAGVEPAHDRVAARRQEMAATRDAVLPDVIFGDVAPLPAADDWTLVGVPTARGQYAGPARIVRAPEEFDRVQPGDVLVIPFADVAWTPLFGKAGAVVSESGGLLSHSSIVAREYGIPAVVSVTGACRRLRDGMVVSVDGFSGRVSVRDVPERPGD